MRGHEGSSLLLTLVCIVCIRVYSVRDLSHPFFQFGIRLQAFLHPPDNAAYRAVTVYGKVFSYLCQLIAPEFASQIDGYVSWLIESSSARRIKFILTNVVKISNQADNPTDVRYQFFFLRNLPFVRTIVIKTGA